MPSPSSRANRWSRRATVAADLCAAGNPASAMVTFWLFVRPALRRMMGHEDGYWQAHCAGAWQRPCLAPRPGTSSSRQRLFPGRRGSRASGVPAGSHDVGAYGRGTALVRIPARSEETPPAATALPATGGVDRPPLTRHREEQPSREHRLHLSRVPERRSGTRWHRLGRADARRALAAEGHDVQVLASADADGDFADGLVRGALIGRAPGTRQAADGTASSPRSGKAPEERRARRDRKRRV